MKVFGALGYAHTPDEKRGKLDAKAFKCRFIGYDDEVKGSRVQNIETGKVQIVRAVPFVETTSPGNLVTHCEEEDVESTSAIPSLSSSHPGDATQIVPVEVEVG
ncbi:hypothetical protein PC121_g8679 [Phytophthora cactorum]|nr:hypothetical protein PC121_g8679 [Phytophthora cactorum]